MKKQILAIAIATGLTAAPLLAQAEATVYGRAHVSLDHVETGGGASAGGTDAEFDLNDRKSAFGVKSKEDLGGGLTVMAKFEWSVNPTDVGSAIGVRDRWIGLKKAGMGTVKFGTLSSNYKETAAKMDPFWHTAAEGRGTGSTSDLSNSSGDDGGRMSNLLHFSSAPMGGMQVVLNAQLNGTGEMTTGLGIRYEAKGLYVFADMLNIENDANTDGVSDHRRYAAGESATKFGVKYTMDALTAGVVVEQTADVTAVVRTGAGTTASPYVYTVTPGAGYDYTTLMATYALNDNDTVAFTYGMAAHDTAAAADMDTVALGYMHNMSKSTTVYAAYVDRSSDTASAELNGLTFGLKHSF
ncbi:MAG: porin [Gammaproteobacteria bacterium]|nr:porin [Gammaproteobacteria bacterium]